MVKTPVKTTLTLVLLSLCFSWTFHSGEAGERIGNGDPRRHRAHRAMLYIAEVLDLSDVTPVRVPGLDWVAGHQRFFREVIENSKVV